MKQQNVEKENRRVVMKLFSNLKFLLIILCVGELVSQKVLAQPTQKTSANYTEKKSENAIRLNVFLPGAQMRYQDTSSQSQELVTHYTYTISGQLNDKILLGFEYLTLKETSGNRSYYIDRNFSEQAFFFGYTAVKRDFLVSGKFTIEFMLTPEIILGQNTSDVTTRLLGTSQTVGSAQETSYGVGVIGTAMVGYLIVETDFRYQTSKSYEPGSLMLGTVRIGADFRF